MRKEIKIGLIVGVIIAVSTVIFLLSQNSSEPMAIPDTANFNTSVTKPAVKEPLSVKQPVPVKTEAASRTETAAPAVKPTAAIAAPSNAIESTQPAVKANDISGTQPTTTTQPTTAQATQSAINTTVKAENNIAPANATVKAAEVKPVLSPVKASEPTVYHQQMNEPRFHVVKKGDSLSSISVKYFGSAKYWQSIYNANKNIVTNASSLRIGWKLRIPSPEEVE